MNKRIEKFMYNGQHPKEVWKNIYRGMVEITAYALIVALMWFLLGLTV